MDSRNGAFALILTLAAVLATQGFAPVPTRTFRSCAPVLEQEICTWVLIEAGAVLELGVTVPLGLVETVPDDAEMSWPPQQLAAIVEDGFEHRFMPVLEHLHERLEVARRRLERRRRGWRRRAQLGGR